MEYMAKSQSGLYREYYSSNIIFCLYLDSGRVILSIAHGDCSLALMNCIQNLQELGGQLTSPSFFSICCRLLDTASKSLGSEEGPSLTTSLETCWPFRLLEKWLQCQYMSYGKWQLFISQCLPRRKQIGKMWVYFPWRRMRLNRMTKQLLQLVCVLLTF